MGDFKRANEVTNRIRSINVNLSWTDDIPTTRKGRINMMMSHIIAGEKEFGGCNLQKLLSTYSIRFGMKRVTVAEYVKALENNGYVRIGNDLKAHPTQKGIDA